MAAGILDLDPHVMGDTWVGIPSIIIKIDGVAPDADLVSVRMQFRSSPGAETIAFELSTANTLITHVSNQDWEIRIDPIAVDELTPRTWYYDMEFTDVADVITTYLKGKMVVTQAVTR